MTIASGIINEKGASVLFERETQADSTTGAQLSTTWATLSTLTGWLQPISSTESAGLARVAFGVRELLITHKLYLASDPATIEGDRATIGGVTYRVASAPLDQAGVGECWKVMLAGDN